MAFEHREVDKTYLAYANGAPAGIPRLDVPLCEARRGKSRPAAPGEAGGKHAVTEIAVEHTWRVAGEPVARVRCHPLTGRHHQIRVHLRSVEAPIVHDPL